MNHKIKIIDVDGTRAARIRGFVGSGVAGRGLNSGVNGVDNNGNSTGNSNANSDFNSNREEIDKASQQRNKEREIGLKDVQLDAPQGVAYDRTRRVIYVADTGNNRILMINRDTSLVSEIALDFSAI